MSESSESRTGRPGVKDVAVRAGVSPSTVSNVLNHPERVSHHTRLRVEQAMADLGFVRNDSARKVAGLRQAPSHSTSIREVAKLAGVSTGTVSNVLNRPKGVTASNRLRVEQAMTALNFVPHEAARDLRMPPSTK